MFTLLSFTPWTANRRPSTEKGKKEKKRKPQKKSFNKILYFFFIIIRHKQNMNLISVHKKG